MSWKETPFDEKTETLHLPILSIRDFQKMRLPAVLSTFATVNKCSVPCLLATFFS